MAQKTNKSREIIFSKRGRKDFAKIEKDKHLAKKALHLLGILESDPFAEYPECEKLSGDLGDAYSRRINIQHRLVYKVFDDHILILAMWSHYENI